jgi:hypothetical protein
MRRRVLYVLIGSLAFNLVMMSIMFVRSQGAENCDVSTRGLAVLISNRGVPRDAHHQDRARWVMIMLPLKASDLPPCRARRSQHLEVLPG